MNRIKTLAIAIGCLLMFATAPVIAGSKAHKPSPAQSVKMLQDGNSPFVAGKSNPPHTDSKRLILASSNQAKVPCANAANCKNSKNCKDCKGCKKDIPCKPKHGTRN